jgi:hypothetical protein
MNAIMPGEGLMALNTVDRDAEDLRTMLLKLRTDLVVERHLIAAAVLQSAG